MRIIPQLDKYPRLVVFCETSWGKLALLPVFAVALRVDGVGPWIAVIAVTLAAAACSFLPRYRHSLLTVTALFWLLFHNNWTNWAFIQHVMAAGAYHRKWAQNLLIGCMLGGIFLCFAVFFKYVRRRPATFAARRPVLTMLSVYAVVLVAAGELPLQGTARAVLWTFVALWAPYLWYLAYALQDAASKTPDNFAVQFGTFYPFYRTPFASPTPIGKGRAYLRKSEARTPKDLSVVQLKAVKLLLWIAVLRALEQLFLFVAHGGVLWFPLQFLERRTGWKIATLALPNLDTAIGQMAAGSRIPSLAAWLIVIAHFIEALLGLYIAGNTVVACCRMAGFYILRNTYRPLQAQTIAEFWNRYYYYFKELLVEFFFFPTYMRYFKKYRRVRMLAATISAATLGNMAYHFFRDFYYVADLGIFAALSGFQVYAFYSLLLGIGIGASQLRAHRSDSLRSASPIRRAISCVIVVTFFCLLEVFDYESRSHTLASHLVFFTALFSFHA